MNVIVLACTLSISAFGMNTEPESELELLRPDDPVAYFERAEEIAAAASDETDRDLARRLYVLSYTLAPNDPMAAWLKPSVCLALASLERQEARRRWLRAVAGLLDDRYAPLSREPERFESSSDAEGRLAFAQFVALTRGGRGSLARAREERPDFVEIRDELQNAVIEGRPSPPLSKLESEAEIWPCPQCSNARSVPDPEDPEESRVLCPTCRGNPGPRLSMREIIGYVALEALALQADGETWSSDHALMNTGPLRDPDADAIHELYPFNHQATVYKSGEWIVPTPRQEPAEP